MGSLFIYIYIIYIYLLPDKRREKKMKTYNLRGKISNQLPVVVITDDLTVSVNNRVDNMLLVRKYINDKQKEIAEADIKRAAGEEAPDIEETELMYGTLNLLVGKSNSEKVRELNLPIPEFKMVYTAIMAAAQGKDPETLDLEEDGEEKPGFQK